MAREGVVVVFFFFLGSCCLAAWYWLVSCVKFSAYVTSFHVFQVFVDVTFVDIIAPIL